MPAFLINYARAACVIAQRFLACGPQARCRPLPAATADAQFLAALCREQDATLRATLACQPGGKRPSSLTGLRPATGASAGDEP